MSGFSRFRWESTLHRLTAPPRPLIFQLMILTFGPETLAMWKVDENKATRVPSHTPGARGGGEGKGKERKREKTRPKTKHTHRVNLSNSPQNPHPPPTAPTTIPSPIDRMPVLTPQGVIIQKKNSRLWTKQSSYPRSNLTGAPGNNGKIKKAKDRACILNNIRLRTI